jgi:hypothetical protein
MTLRVSVIPLFDTLGVTSNNLHFPRRVYTDQGNIIPLPRLETVYTDIIRSFWREMFNLLVVYDTVRAF